MVTKETTLRLLGSFSSLGFMFLVPMHLIGCGSQISQSSFNSIFWYTCHLFALSASLYFVSIFLIGQISCDITHYKGWSPQMDALAATLLLIFMNTHCRSSYWTSCSSFSNIVGIVNSSYFQITYLFFYKRFFLLFPPFPLTEVLITLYIFIHTICCHPLYTYNFIYLTTLCPTLSMFTLYLP